MRRTAFALATVLLAATASFGGAPGDPDSRVGGRPAVKVPFPAIQDFSSLTIRLERTACYGWCPVYTVEISGDGSVSWYGERFVETVGARSAKIPVKKVRALFKAFVRADFFWTYDEYTAPITDLPTQILTIRFDGKSKTVVDYAGGHIGMPKAIDDLEDAVDAAAGSKAWIGNPPHER